MFPFTDIPVYLRILSLWGVRFVVAQVAHLARMSRMDHNQLRRASCKWFALDVMSAGATEVLERLNTFKLTCSLQMSSIYIWKHFLSMFCRTTFNPSRFHFVALSHFDLRLLHLGAHSALMKLDGSRYTSFQWIILGIYHQCLLLRLSLRDGFVLCLILPSWTVKSFLINNHALCQVRHPYLGKYPVPMDSQGVT